MGSGALVGIKQTEKRLHGALLALTVSYTGLGRGAANGTGMIDSEGEAQLVSLETFGGGTYICACPGAALPEGSLRKRKQGSDAQRRAVGDEMDPELFLQKVSTLQVGMELRVHLGSGAGPSGEMLSHNVLLARPRTALKNAELWRA